jgi:probable HAF family extracellular repeat protein
MVVMVRVAFLSSLLLVTGASAQPQYSVTPLNPSFGGRQFRALSMASDGTISGWLPGVSGSPARAYTWRNGSVNGYDGYPGLGTFAEASNGAGLVVGQASRAGVPGHAAKWEGGQFQDLGSLAGDSFGSEARQVNESGWIVGKTQIADNGIFPSRPFIYRNGVMQDLGPIGIPSLDNNGGVATGINNVGQVTGFFVDVESNNKRAFFWSDATGMQMLANVNMFAYDINDAGQIVGNLPDVGGLPFGVGYVWQNGSYTELGTAIYPQSINNQGVMVGFGRQVGAVIRTSMGQVQTLDSLLTEPGWHLSQAIDINDAGQILAHAGVTPTGGLETYVILNPVPEPSALMACVILFGALWILRRSRDA